MNKRVRLNPVGPGCGRKSLFSLGRTHAGKNPRRDGLRRGLVLVLVLVCMTLAGALLVIISQSLAQQAKTVRHERQALILRQLIDSGHAWAYAHPDQWGSETGVSLDASAIAPPDGGATVPISVLLSLGSGPAGRETLVITARLTIHGRSVERTSRFATHR